MTLTLYKPHKGGSSWASTLPVDPARCAVKVFGRDRWGGSYQCTGKAKHDAVIDGQQVRVCTTHSPEKMAEREAAKQANYEREQRRYDRVARRPAEYEAALRAIAAGHNDPRSLAREALEKWGDL